MLYSLVTLNCDIRVGELSASGKSMALLEQLLSIIFILKRSRVSQFILMKVLSILHFYLSIETSWSSDSNVHHRLVNLLSCRDLAEP